MRWSSLIPTGFLVSRGTWVTIRSPCCLRLRGCHALRPGLPSCSSDFGFSYSVQSQYSLLMIPTTLCMQRVLPWHMHSLDFIPFARRYLGYHCYFLFLRVLRCFSSPGLTSSQLWIHCGIQGYDSLWVPPFGNPWVKRLFATNHGFSQLTASFFVFQRPGSLRVPLVA